MIRDFDPLILTLGFDAASFQRFDQLRRSYFPPERNLIPAHLTLFHHLPGDQLARVADEVAAAARSVTPFAVEVAGLRKLGRGVALDLHSPEVLALRGRLAGVFVEILTPQDRQGFRPHITIQNKVEPNVAAALHDRLARDFTPWMARAEALLLWRYRGGPWDPAARSDLGG